MTSTLEAHQGLEQLVTCPICEEIYTDPIALPCLHTLCKLCVDTIREKSKDKNGINCPCCRKHSKIRLLQKDFKTQNLVDHYNSVTDSRADNQFIKLACGLCSVRPIGWKCLQCQEYLCKGCKTSHAKIRQLSDHVCVSIATFVADKIEILHSLKQSLVEQCETIAVNCTELEAVIAEAARDESSKVADVEAAEADLRTAVDKHCASLRKRLRDHFADNTTPHRDKLNDLQSQLNDMKTKIEVINSVIDINSAEDILEMDTAAMTSRVTQCYDSMNNSLDKNTLTIHWGSMEQFAENLQNTLSLENTTEQNALRSPNSSETQAGAKQTTTERNKDDEHRYILDFVSKCEHGCSSLNVFPYSVAFTRLYARCGDQIRGYAPDTGALLDSFSWRNRTTHP